MWDFFKLVHRNTLRHPLRSGLTVLGMALALSAFTLIRTVISAWYSGVEQTAQNRLVVRNSISLMFYLPHSYFQTIARLPGIEKAGFGNWFGGIYRDEARSQFQQFAIDDGYLDLYPEYVVSPAQKAAYLNDRKGALVGRELADQFGLKPGDQLQLRGTIFPGLFDFVVQGIIDGRTAKDDTRIMFFHWEYLNERNRLEIKREPDHVGFYVVKLLPGADPAAVSRAIDERFANSYAETLTETETAFVQGFVSMSSAIITALRVISYLVVAVMLLVLTNTMLLSVRERMHEYAILKALGFSAARLFALVFGEALLLTAGGFILLCLGIVIVFSIPPPDMIQDLGNFFPYFAVKASTMAAAVVVTLSTGLVAAAAALRGLSHKPVAEALREAG